MVIALLIIILLISLFAWLAAEEAKKMAKNIGKLPPEQAEEFGEVITQTAKEQTEVLEKLIKENRQELKENRQELGKNLKDGFDIFGKNFNRSIKTQTDGLSKLSSRVETHLKDIQTDNNKKLEDMRQTVDEKLQSTLEKRFNASFNQVGEQLKVLHEGIGEMKNLASNVDNLQKTLTNVSQRGAWGEAQLGNLLAQIFSPNQYETQFNIKKGDSFRVDFAIKMPLKNNQVMYLPIDAKFPLADYEQLLNLIKDGDIKGIEKSRKSLGQRIKAEAKKISEKYIQPPLTTNFAIMYLPSEGVFAEVTKDQELIEEIHHRRVNLAGPTTIAAMLGIVQIGYQSLEIQQRTSEVWNKLAILREDFSKFGGLLEKAGKKINEAGNVIETASSKQRNIDGQLQRLGKLDEPKEVISVDLIDRPSK